MPLEDWAAVTDIGKKVTFEVLDEADDDGGDVGGTDDDYSVATTTTTMTVMAMGM